MDPDAPAAHAKAPAPTGRTNQGKTPDQQDRSDHRRIEVGAAIGLIGVVFGSWFTARRQDRMWLREQKLKAGIGFNTAVVQLLDYLKETQLSDDGPGANELANRMQEARSALYLLCTSDTVDLADALARRVWSTRPTDGRDDRRAEFRETLDLLRRFTHQLRQEIARS